MPLSDLPDFFSSRWGKIAALLICGVMFCLILILMVRFYSIFSEPIVVESKTVLSTATTKQEDSSKIIDAHIFGTYIPKGLNGQDVKKSLLNLKVIGIMLAKPSKFSQVVIASPNGKQRVYHQGDTLPGGAKIKNIMKSGVLIERNGQLESLMMPKDSLTFDPMPGRLNLEQE